MFPSPVASRDEGKVYRAVTGPTGALLALVMDTLDGEVRLFDALSLAPRGTLLLGAARTVRGCAVAPDDASLAVATPDDVTLFDIASGRVRWTVAHSGDEPAIAVSPDGERIAVGVAPDKVMVLSARDGATVSEFAVSAEPRALVWDRTGLVMLAARQLSFLDAAPAVRATVTVGGGEGDEALELVAIDHELVALAGQSEESPWLEVRKRDDGKLVTALRLEGDRRAEGLAFAGGVLFISTEGGTYRADPPYEPLVRWLPPLGGAHDPTRLAAVADSHVAVAARDVRVFRTRS